MHKKCAIVSIIIFSASHGRVVFKDPTSGSHNLGAIRDSGSSDVGGRRAILQNCAPDRRSHPAAGPFFGVGVLLEVVNRVAIVQTPDTIHQLAVILERCQLPA